MMCRGKAECPELGNDPDRWDRYCPLRPPTWFEGQLDIFISAVNEFVDGKQARCIDILSTIRSDEMRDWFIEHGLPSGKHRARVLKKPKPVFLAKELRDPLRSPKRYEAEVFQRDGYRCRYCGIRLVSNKLLKALIKKLNIETFSRHSKDILTNGIIHIFYPVADHVTPWVLGGKTQPDNLVASCGPCNYGKFNFTIEQIGIENPFSREPKVDNWDGLISKLNIAKAHKIL